MDGKLVSSLRCLLTAGALWLVSGGSAHSALIIPFSFTDTSGPDDGTVVGRILGLTAGETSQRATSVEILESPFDDSIGDYLLVAPSRNSFDLDAGGTVTLADFVGDFFVNDTSQGFRLDFSGPAETVGSNRIALAELGGGSRALGFAPAVPDIFLPPVASVPAPAPWGLLMIGLGALAIARRRVGAPGSSSR